MRTPTPSERLYAARYDYTLPVTITSKMIRVTTGELLWSHVATAECGGDERRLLREAVDQAVEGMLTAVRLGAQSANCRDCD